MRITHTQSCSRPQRQRGMAMVMVMIVISAAGVLAFGMTAANSVRARVAQSSSTRLQAQYLAESGLNLAVYYLKNPAASPVGVGFGENGNVHYRGEDAITIEGMPGTISVMVTNPANRKFLITSIGTYDGQRITATATVTVKKSKQLNYAAYLTGAVKPSLRTTITGGLLTNGSLQVSVVGQVTGLVSSLAGGLLADVQSTDFTYPVSTFHYLPKYYYNGQEYTAKKFSGNWNGGAMIDSSANNPLNIWYADKTIKIKGVTTINGSIIVAAGKDLEVEANLTLTPKADFPTLVAGRDIVFTKDSVTVNSTGVTYVANQVKVSGTTGLLSSFKVNGSLMSPKSGFPVATTFGGIVNIAHSAPNAKMEAFADEMEAIDSVTVTSWETDNLRLQ